MKIVLGEQIAALRRERGMTQDALAAELGVTNQAVSKWESGMNYPDVTLIPAIAEYFGVTTDRLFFGTEPEPADGGLDVLKDDDMYRILQFKGKKLMNAATSGEGIRLIVENWKHKVGQTVIEVYGNVTAKELWNVNADGGVECSGDICGNVVTGKGGGINCGGDICGNAATGEGGSINCEGDICGNAEAGGDLKCDGDICGNAEAGGDLKCDGDVCGDARAGGDIIS
ncbi:MAG: helix-turn-helix transcriptional regulator [Clostridia bacterium]|nr:helix-turn-helix transcriptional regulator [Clostridia bacterium]